MFDIIPLVLMLLSMGVILFLSIKKFPMLANLDVDTIQAEREARFKEQILGTRLRRSIVERQEKIDALWVPLRDGAREFFAWIIKKLIDVKTEHAKEKNILAEENTVETDLVVAEKLVADGNFDEAESKYISIISRDSKNIEAFKELGLLYLERKKFTEALETLKHAAKLGEKAMREHADDANLRNNLAEMYFSLADCARELNDDAQALTFLESSLSIHPANPRFLDMKLEISIISKDKKTAEATLADLANVNPENNKIAEFQKRIDEIPLG